MLEEYPNLQKYTHPVKPPERDIVGRDSEIRSIRAAMMRPELCNVILLGEAGAGKSAIVQAMSVKDEDREYREVDVTGMIADAPDANKLASILKSIFDGVVAYCHEQEKEMVLFIDEFHQIVHLSPAAVEALKPMLADSGTRGIRVIVATTYTEFRQWIAPNQPLVERLHRINIGQPDQKTTVAILKGMAKRYGVDNQFNNDSLYNAIYELTNRYIPANSQPRKSLVVFDEMIGWHRAEGRKLDKSLLADVIAESEGVNISFSVDASRIKESLDEKVLAQQYASSVIEKRLNICVADLHNKNKPMSSFLFCGSSGCGKTEMARTMAGLLFGDSRNLIIMDMTEYANPDSLERFRRELTARIWERPHSILLLDEIEKACAPVTRVLLQVLDNGRLMDENNREVSFLNSYIIMTTNASSELFKTIAQYNADDAGSGAFLQDYERQIRRSLSNTTGDNRFPPELLGRIDCIVPFQPLSRKTMERIAFMKLDNVRLELLDKYNIRLEVKSRVLDFLIEDNGNTDADAGGARTVVSKLESEVVAPLAKFINTNPNVRRIGIKIKGKLASEDLTKRVSDAYVEVVAIE